jgi:predicted RNase H-like nuclease (RuvC/YqgF family)
MSQNISPGGTIDPNSFTPDELLKHIYRSVTMLNEKMDAQEKHYQSEKKQQDGRIEKVNERITVLETKLLEKEKYFKVLITIISTVLGTISVGIAILSFFTK